MQNDLGSRLRVADAIALALRAAHDPMSMLTYTLSKNTELEQAEKEAAHAEERRAEVKEAAPNMNPLLRHLFE